MDRSRRARRLMNGIAALFAAVVVGTLVVSAVGAFTGSGAPAATGPVETGRIAIDIEGLAFTNGTRRVAVGTTVTWRNVDDTPHTVTATDGKAFGSDSLAKGDTFSSTFTERGSDEYFCTIHPFMTGTIEVVLPYGLEP